MVNQATQIRNLPNLILAGTGRAGTTSLFRYLADHPRVCASSVKEVHFFDDVSLDRLNQQALMRYGSYFCHCSPDIPIRMEATPQYLYGGKRIAEAIYGLLPDVKLIFTLREPVSRAFTVFRANRTRDPETFGLLSFDDFVTIGLDGEHAENNIDPTNRAERISTLLTQGCYARPLSEYFSVFPLEQIYIVFFDDLVRDVRMVMRGVAEFLDIDFHFYDSYTFDVENRTRSYRFSLLHRFAYGLNMRLEPMLNRHPSVRRVIRRIYDRVNERKDPEDQISEFAQRRLQEFYGPYNRELYELLKDRAPRASAPEWIANAGGA